MRNQSDLDIIDQYVSGLSNKDLNALAARSPASQDSVPDDVMARSQSSGIPLESIFPSKGPPAQVQSEPEITISANTPDPLEFPEGYKQRVKATSIIPWNLNPAIKGRMRDSEDLGANVRDLSGSVAKSQSNLRSILDEMRKSSTDDAYKPNEELEAMSAEAKDRLSKVPSIPDRDLLSEVILSFGPALLGGLSGESGRAAAKPAGQGARTQYEGYRKEIVDSIKEQQKALNASIKEIQALKIKDREAFDKGKGRELDRYKALLTGEQYLNTANTADLRSQLQMLNQANKEIADLTKSGAFKMADLEKPPEFRPLVVKPGKPADKYTLEEKKTIENLSTKNANKVSIKNQIDAVMSKWDSLSNDQKLASGRQLLKTLNSTEGADAIGAEEANRLGSKLEFAMGNLTNSNPVQFGRDLDGFAEQARNTSKAIGTAIESNRGIMKSIDAGRGIPSQSTPGKTAPTKKADKVVQDFANANKLSYDQALSILKKRGYSEK